MSKKHKKVCRVLNYIDYSSFVISITTRCVLVIKKKKKKHDKIVFLAKSKLNNIEVLISKTLIDWNISHDQSVLINNVLKKILWYERRNQKF